MADYTDVTEVPGSHATRDQVARLYHRYHLAAARAANRRVLEVACGTGQGLGYLSRTARSVVGGDYTAGLVQIGQSHYRGRIPLLRLDGQYLPFRDGSFDLVVMFEAIYYLPDAGLFVAESHRVLSPGGELVVGTVNKDWSEFARSPFSTRYYSVPELHDVLRQRGFANVEFFGAFQTASTSLTQTLVSVLRRAVVALNLMPKTLEGRARFKRIFYGQLVPLKPELDEGMPDLYPTVPIPADRPTTDFKIVYAVARR